MGPVLSDAVTRFRAAYLAHDLEAMTAELGPDFELHSAVAAEPIRGRDAGRPLFQALLEVFDHVHYLGELSGAVWNSGPAQARVLLFRGHVDNVAADGIALLQVDDSDRIAVMTSMIRPMAAMTALSERIHEFLETGL
ncbi:nuclear transport factor 2 family protein [Nocardia sp. CDC159]|uniref:Nuclear transport factor 2 family protein n=1 Tax=Nocardia pulmonis TaxID=2951408 RepID=A0A9X2E4Z6_9NOCA|nr:MULTISPECIES: nuclear transport factor 2 family protein [Nocardia]MCM6773163.1 nuclear transport factor 2 family protein [Nocardia pulmonis]MCM6785534.1 nuclear transport factor 2 family protein [Nocardia sp. CDC159]